MACAFSGVPEPLEPTVDTLVLGPVVTPAALVTATAEAPPTVAAAGADDDLLHAAGGGQADAGEKKEGERAVRACRVHAR